MREVIVDKCPVNDNSGNAVYSQVIDHYFGTPGTWTYLRDQDTGHLWISPRPADIEIPALYQRYYTHGTAPQVVGTRLQQAYEFLLHRRLGYDLQMPAGIIARLLARLPTLGAAAAMETLKIPATATGRLLDFGCGDGTFMHRMRRAGWLVSGVEPDQAAVNNLRGRYGYDVRLSLEDFGSGEEGFDVVTLCHVIEHMADPIAALRALRRVLKPGGLVIIVTPNANSLGAKIFGKFWRGLEPPRHFNVFTLKSLRSSLQQAGYAVHDLTSETRSARRLFWMSLLAFRGLREIELNPRSERLVKWAGYCFQLVEAMSTVLGRESGEEIYCRSTPESPSVLHGTSRDVS
jgi:2-polyprenyl-3-methyl-5-hydroxy-6-metoxy-1,4-benzoquinol methylase